MLLAKLNFIPGKESLHLLEFCSISSCFFLSVVIYHSNILVLFVFFSFILTYHKDPICLKNSKFILELSLSVQYQGV